MIKILQNPRNSFLFVFITAVFKSLFFFEKLRLMQWVWHTGEQARCTVSPIKFSGTYAESKHEVWDSNSCFNRLCWCNWPLGRNRLKTKTDNNYKTKWCSRQQPQNHLVLYTTGTDSIQQDRPLSKKDWLKTKRQTQNKRLTRHPSQDLQKLGFTDAQKCVPDASSKMYQMLPAGGSLYILAVSEPSKSSNWVVTGLPEVGGRITLLSIKSCTSWRRREHPSVLWPDCWCYSVLRVPSADRPSNRQLFPPQSWGARFDR